MPPQASPRKETVVIQLIINSNNPINTIANNISHRESLIIINTPYSWRRQWSEKLCFSIAKPESRWLLLHAWWVLSMGRMLANPPLALDLNQYCLRDSQSWKALGGSLSATPICPVLQGG